MFLARDPAKHGHLVEAFEAGLSRFDSKADL